MCVDLIDDSPNKAKASGPLGSILTFGRHVVVTDSDLNPNAFQGTPPAASCRDICRLLKQLSFFPPSAAYFTHHLRMASAAGGNY